MEEHKHILEMLDDVWGLRGKGKYPESKNLLEKVQLLAAENDFNAQGRIFHIYMQYEYDHNNYGEALKFSKKSISFYVKANNMDRIAHSVRHRADLERQLEEYDKAKISYQKSIDIYKNKIEGSKGDLANALRGYGLLLEKLKLNKKALQVWEEILVIYNNAQIPQGIMEANEKILGLKSGLD